MPRAQTRIQPLSGQVGLVTGATRGIGLAISRALAAECCDLMLTGRNESALARRQGTGALKIRVFPQPCDVRDPHSVDALFRSVRRQFRRLDILINNAGIAHPNLPVEKLPFPVWKDVLETNLNGIFLVTQAALAMMKRDGTIVNNLSIAANRVFAGSRCLQCLQARSPRPHQHPARGIASQRNSCHRPSAWRNRYRHLDHALASSPPPQNDVARNRGDAVIEAILLPANATVENLEMLPTGGTL